MTPNPAYDNLVYKVLIWLSNRMLKRIAKELADHHSECGNPSTKLPFAFGPVDQDMAHLQASIIGPENTPYADGVFLVDIQLPLDYPFKPPKVVFTTKMLHPNITERGANNLDIFKDHWSPALTISKCMLSLCSLLADPNFDDPLRPELSRLYKEDPKAYYAKVRADTLKYAT